MQRLIINRYQHTLRKKNGIVCFINITFLFLSPLIVYQVIFLAKDMIYGDRSAQHLIISPRYDFERCPENDVTLKYNAVNRLAADFAQVYFPSQKLSSFSEAYAESTTLDPWQRPSRYAPFIHFICQVTFCKLQYGYASFFHIAIQLVVFLSGFIFSFYALQIKKYLYPSLLGVILCLFLSPVGLSWFERGQFSLYVALSYLWLHLGIMKEKRAYVVFSAFFAFMKWTSLPYIVIIFSMAMLASKNLKELKYRVQITMIFFSTFALLFLCFMNDSVHFLHGLISQEFNAFPDGISLIKIFPRYFVKGLPFFLIILGYVNSQKHQDIFVSLIPYFTGAAILLLTYPTLAYEYSMPCLLGFIPLIFYWSTKPGMNKLMNNIITYSFLFFLCLSSFSVKIVYSELVLIAIYSGFSISYMLSPLFYQMNYYHSSLSRPAHYAVSSVVAQCLLGTLVLLMCVKTGLVWLEPSFRRGLYGTYYLNTQWQEEPWKSDRLTTEISSKAEDFLKARELSRNRFSIEWTGFLEISESSEYRFFTNSDDGSWLFIDDTLIVDNGGAHGLFERQGRIYLSRGVHRIRIRYVQFGGAARLETFWQKQQRYPTLKQPLSSAILYPPDIPLWQLWIFQAGKALLSLFAILGMNVGGRWLMPM